MNWKAFVIMAIMFGALCYWVAMQLAAPCAGPVEYRETLQERARIVTRIHYHGLNGVVVLKEVGGSWRFYRQSQWCRL